MEVVYFTVCSFQLNTSVNLSIAWHVTTWLKLHQPMKHITIQPHSLLETIFERHEKTNHYAQYKLLKIWDIKSNNNNFNRIY